MALSQLAKKIDEGVPWRTCAVCHALDSLSPEDAAGFRALMANKSLRYKEISALIAEDPDTPLVIPDGTIGRHATGGCSAREKLR